MKPTTNRYVYKINTRNYLNYLLSALTEKRIIFVKNSQSWINDDLKIMQKENLYKEYEVLKKFEEYTYREIHKCLKELKEMKIK